MVLDGSRRALHLPRPGAAALPLLALALLSAALAAVPDLPWEVGAAAAGLFLAAALTRVAQASLELRRLRAAADGLLLRASPRTRPPALLAWRAAELTSPRHRRGLARALRHVVRELDPRTLPGAAPLDRPGARPYAGRLADLADVVDDLSAGVSARALLQLERLLSDPASPLFGASSAPGSLEQELARIERAIRAGGRAPRSLPGARP